MPEFPKKRELASLLESISDQTIYDASQSRIFNRRELKAASVRDKQYGRFDAAFARAKVSTLEMERILPLFRILLDKFVDSKTDRIGNGLVRIFGGRPEPTLSEYVQIIVRASATLGGERTAELLIGWVQGEPVRFREISVLNGITVARPLTLHKGLQIYQLPRSLNELIPHLPAMSLDIHDQSTMLGRVALSIEYEDGPALYHPSIGDIESKKLNYNQTQEQINNFSFDSLYEAMSLACNGCVQWRYCWRDFGDVKEFLNLHGGISWKDEPEIRHPTKFTQNHLECAIKIHKFLSAKVPSTPNLETAIKRWIKSKASNSPIEDRLIDLRIALESLYLDTNEGELRFRLACYGAWHIGKSATERKKIFQTLMETYKLASKAVHRGKLSTKDKTGNLLETSQDFCREGILKRLEEETKPEWNDVIMGEGS